MKKRKARTFKMPKSLPEAPPMTPKRKPKAPPKPMRTLRTEIRLFVTVGSVGVALVGGLKWLDLKEQQMWQDWD